MAVLGIIVGLIAILVGIFGKTFYSADVWGGSIGDTSIPRWLGRLLAVGVGIFLLVVGIASFMNGSSSIHLTW
jgi:hypothetical protein